MLRAIKIRLYPDQTQIYYINNLLGCYRKVYNLSLALKQNAYIENGENYNIKEIGKEFHNNWTKNEEFFYLKDHNTKVLKQSVIDMLSSYHNFFINGSGFPKFKSKHGNKQSCRFPVDAISIKNNYLSNKITLVKQIKDIKFKCSEEYKKYLDKHKSNIKSATLTKTKYDTYLLSILVDGDLMKEYPQPKNEYLGIDLGVKTFIVDSENNKYENIKIKTKNEKKLSKLQREVSKKKKGSKNRNKARKKLAKFHNKLNNIKENYLHEISNKLIDENQVIMMEDLSVKDMMEDPDYAKWIQELSLSKFKNMLIYKAEWSGRHIVQVERYFPSSKLCSVCGYKKDDLTINDRMWVCPDCGTTHDRDHNAAKNILNEGKRLFILNKDKELNKSELNIQQ